MYFKNLFGLTCGFGLLAATNVLADLPKASELVDDMGFGFNIGNTMEVPSDPTLWGNSFPTQEYVQAIKDAGFGTVRIPCAWDSHASNGTISSGWLDSVQTVVDYAINAGLYVILNSHWDNGWLEDHVFDGDGYDQTYSSTGTTVNIDADSIANLQSGYWTQIAKKFADYDEHLIFASANEPGVNDPWLSSGQWEFTTARAQVLQKYHEACAKAVRGTGGNNATRTIVYQMPRTEIDNYTLLVNYYPEDPAGNEYTMAEAHYYPYQYSLMTTDADWGNCFYYYDGMESTTDTDHNMGSSVSTLGTKLYTAAQFDKLKSAFVDKGIPVVIGEMGAIKRLEAITGDNLELHLQGRAAWYGDVAAAAKERGIIPCVWDTGDEGNENMTIIRRQTSKYGGNVGDIVDIETLNALRTAYGLTELDGESIIDSLVEASTDTTDKMLQVTYTSVQSDSSETGTIRFDYNGVDWSNYTSIRFQMKAELSSDALTGETYGWSQISFFAMSSDSWTWSDYNIDNDDVSDDWDTYEISFSSLSGFTSSDVKSIGINVYGTQLSGTILIDNIELCNASGCTTLDDLNKKTPTTEGIASGTLVASTAPATTTSISQIALTANKMQINIQQGSITALFNATSSTKATAMLVNSKGQIISQANFQTNKGTNAVELKNNYRGPGLLIIKQGSQLYSQKVILK